MSKINHDQGTYFHGTASFCAGCGVFQGIFCTVLTGDEEESKEPEWPFSKVDCPVCYWKSKAIYELDSEEIAKQFSMKTILNALMMKRAEKGK